MSNIVNIAFVATSTEKVIYSLKGEITNAIRDLKARKPKYDSINYEIVFWDKCDKNLEEFTHLVFTAGTVYTHCTDEFMAWMNNLPEKISKNLYNCKDIVTWNISKTYLKDLGEIGVRLPATAWLSKDRIPEITSEFIMSKLKQNSGSKKQKSVVKALVSKNITDAEGLSTVKIGLENETISEDNLERIRKQVADSFNGVMVQPYFENIKLEGEWSLMYFDKKYSHCVLKKAGDTDFRVHEQYGGWFEPVKNKKVPKDILEFGNLVMSKLNFSHRLLYARVDMIRNNEGQPCLFELELFEPFFYVTEDEHVENFLNCLL